MLGPGHEHGGREGAGEVCAGRPDQGAQIHFGRVSPLPTSMAGCLLPYVDGPARRWSVAIERGTDQAGPGVRADHRGHRYGKRLDHVRLVGEEFADLPGIVLRRRVDDRTV